MLLWVSNGTESPSDGTVLNTWDTLIQIFTLRPVWFTGKKLYNQYKTDNLMFQMGKKLEQALHKKVY